jgi:hypothetical protein
MTLSRQFKPVEGFNSGEQHGQMVRDVIALW